MTTAKKLINDPTNVVEEMIEGLVETYPHLQYLDGFPEVKVVLRADVTRGNYSKVALISGGGSGHEPAHAGYVGKGMLTAAVCGDVFASPSATAVLMAIRAVTGPPGCLLIVKNYTGDRLNFGLAAEQAKSEGFKVEVVIVGDDCALQPRGIVGRRGLAGTVLVHKVAGAAAEAGLSLADVAAEAGKLAGLVGTMGVGLTVGSLPGGLVSDRLGPTKMELGLGIHGEPGAAVADLKPVDVVVNHMLREILNPEKAYVPVKLGGRVALLVNSLGGTPPMEVLVAAGKAVAQLQVHHGLAVERVYAGAFVTSLDMQGISLSVVKVDDLILKRLDSPTQAPAWPVGCAGPRPSTTVPVPLPSVASDIPSATRPKELSEGGRFLEAAIKGAAEAVLATVGSLNDWDRQVGDGDCGTTMGKGAKAVLEDLQSKYPLNDPQGCVREIGSSVQRSMGGTSGVLYDIFFRAAVAQMNEGASTPLHWASAFEAGVSAISRYGGATQGQRTMLDSLLPACTTLNQRLKEGVSPTKAFVEAAEAAMEGGKATQNMQAQAGRSTYVPPEKLAQVPDPGAVAAAVVLLGAAQALHTIAHPAP